MTDKRRIVMELLAGEAVDGGSTEEAIKAACRVADLIIEATPEDSVYLPFPPEQD